ncbi:MAG: type II toxin-antitoxin system RelE/ParE family toxin [Nitrospira sp.]|nr:type II toxin-antitoxin system RelE/ParE family toxin [Nitrospira sp.]MDE0405077.1 type II toxin-antitoxin system RelE/ParE family toxin [Nitrospira sp.]MDE0486083.1 type II toxin-antitoxin system RelE/ParE family toxin [Nitrospira sp.]
MREIIFYRTESGGCPIEEFLDALTSQQARKVAWVLQLIEELDAVPVQYFKKLVNTDGIWEVRVPFGGNTFRLLGFLERGNVVILTHGFQKKTQETPKKEIKIAENRKKGYLNRRHSQ